MARFQRDQDVRVARPDHAAVAIAQIDRRNSECRCCRGCRAVPSPGFPCGWRLRPARPAVAVSSMRVPVRARTCSRNCPASTLGKKSWPSSGTSNHEPTQNARNNVAKTPRCSNTAPSSRGSRREIVRSRVQTLLDSDERPHPDAVLWLSSSCSSCVLDIAIKPHDQRRNQRSRDDIAGQHREHHRFRQRHEQVMRHAGQEKHRHEHDADAQAWRQTPAGRFPARRPGWPVPAVCPRPCGDGCFRSPPWHHPPECRPPAPGRPASSG